MEPTVREKRGLIKSRLLTLAKLVIGIGLLALLVTRVPIGDLLASFRFIDYFYLTVLLVLSFGLIAVSTAKWRVLLDALGLHVDFTNLFGLYLIARFFNNFLPTMVGGDVVRTYMLGRDTNNAASATAATVLERLFGVAALFSLLPFALLSDVVVREFPLVQVVVPASVLAFTAALYLVFSARLDGLWQRFMGERIKKLKHFVLDTRAAMGRAARHRPALIHASWLSIVFYLGAVASTWAAVRSVGADVELGYLMAIVPLVLFVAMIPVSLNGLGITETGFAIFLQLAGVSLADSVAVGLLLRASLLLPALCGGLLFLVRRRDYTPRAEDALM
jgi:hypothetical protein